MFRLPFELFLALRYLRPKRTFVSVITLIAIIGVTLGVAVMIIVISVMSGFSRQLRDRLLGFNAHLRVSGATANIHDHDALLARIAAVPGVKGVAPYVLGPILVERRTEAGASRVWAPYVRGVDPRHENAVSQILQEIQRGEANVKGNGMLVGTVLAGVLGVGPGDVVNVLPPALAERMLDQSRRDAEGRVDEAYLPTEFVVRGVFDVGYYEYNASVVVVSLANAQDLYALDDAVHGLMVMLHDPFAAPAVQAVLVRELGPEFEVTTWMEENSSLLDAVTVEKNVMFIVLFFIMIVAAFGISSTLITFVVQKTREIGILKALGCTRGQVSWLFLSQSVFVGVIGVALGFGLGLLAVRYRNEFLHVLRRLTGFELFPAQIYGFSELPALLLPGDVALICGSALVICLLAGLLPAWNAGRLQPVEALRHE